MLIVSGEKERKREGGEMNHFGDGGGGGVCVCKCIHTLLATPLF